VLKNFQVNLVPIYAYIPMNIEVIPVFNIRQTGIPIDIGKIMQQDA